MQPRPKKQRHAYYDHRWVKARNAYIQAHPLCVMCQREGRVTVAQVVDHIRPHKGDLKLFWDQGNWQALCRAHHDAKTASEDGGFGHRVGPRGCDVDGYPLDPGHPWHRS